jgi:hypothetical protein
MDILSLLLTKKHEDVLSEELRQLVICELITIGAKSNLGYFTPTVRFRGMLHTYVECFSLHNYHRIFPLPIISGVACVIKYDPLLFLYVVWNKDCLYEVAAIQDNFRGYNIRVAIINWNNEVINFDKWSLEGGNVISKSQIAASVKRYESIPSWENYQNRTISPR